jgi:hypothetical protein
MGGENSTLRDEKYKVLAGNPEAKRPERRYMNNVNLCLKKWIVIS